MDPGWNIPLAQSAIKWVDEQASKLMSSSWPEVWSPEKWSEREKEDSGLYSSDRVPTIDTFDFYFWNDDGERAGWQRRIILDAFGQPGAGGTPYAPPAKNERKFGFGQNEFLYDSSLRQNSVYADTREQIIHYQFADGSSVAPFRLHSVRSLGWMLYAVCSLQNRLRCKFNEAVFESLLQYFRVHNADDAERAIKINLINRGIIPDGVEFMPIQERWKIDQAIFDTCYKQNMDTMQANSLSYTQDPQQGAGEQRQTATQVMAKVNASAALVGAMLTQGYNYQQFQQREISRRFCIKNSKDKDVRAARLEMLKHGVPEEAINIAAWDVQPVRVIGNGNKMLQQAIAEKLLAIVPQLDPNAQNKVRRLYIASISDDYQLADDLVPQAPAVSDTVHDAQLTLGTLLQGVQVAVRDGVNHVEIIETLLHGLASKVGEVEQGGGMATPEQLQGFQNVMGYIAQHIQILAQNPAEKERVKAYGDDLGQIGSLIKAYQQRLQEAQQQQPPPPNSENGASTAAQDAAKAQAIVIEAQTKDRLKSQSHAQTAAQKQVGFEMKLNQQRQAHDQQMKQRQQTHQASLTEKASNALLTEQAKVKELNTPELAKPE